MTDNTDKHVAWADSIRVVNILVNGTSSTGLLDPSVAIPASTGNSFPLVAPRERFSDEKLRLPPEIGQKELLPIDLLYGRYLPESHTIEIFYSQIDADAPLFGATFGQLLRIVRFHEYAHAILHLGVSGHAVVSQLHQFSENEATVADFLSRRTHSFCTINEATHEFLAQAITYGCILQEERQQAEQLLPIFEALEKRQPEHYLLPADVKEIAHRIDWSLVLEAARGDISVYQEPGFSLYEGLRALAKALASPMEAAPPKHEWCVVLDDSDVAVQDLRQALSDVDAKLQGTSNDPKLVEFLVDRYRGLKIEVFADEHPPPHFRVRCSGEIANYKISDCTQLNGGLARHWRVIRRWHKKHKLDLIHAWDKARPSDCPVGEYRE